MFGLFRKNKKKKNVEGIENKEIVRKEDIEEKVFPNEENAKMGKDEVSSKPARKMPYHITKHQNGGWQIKRGKGKKALKLFDTQKEAINYAKVLEKEKGESYIIHKANGTTRKKSY